MTNHLQLCVQNTSATEKGIPRFDESRF